MSESDRPSLPPSGSSLDVERDSDVPISTQIYWQLTYQIDSGRLLPGSRLSPVRELGAFTSGPWRRAGPLIAATRWP